MGIADKALKEASAPGNSEGSNILTYLYRRSHTALKRLLFPAVTPGAIKTLSLSFVSVFR